MSDKLEDPEAHARAGAAGRVGALLFIAAGFVTIGSVVLPTPEGFQAGAVLTVGAAAVALGLIMRWWPWHKWPASVSLVLVPMSITLITIHNWFGGQDPFRYSIFFLVIFVWLGSFHPRGTAAVAAIPTAGGYLLPLLLSGASASAIASVGYAVPIFVIVGETLAWQGARLRALEGALRRAAMHDALTGLANRRLLLDRLGAALARCSRSDAAVHVLYVDVDDFKSINDTRGHNFGDNVLVAVAHALSASTRPSDTVARLAGVEFVVVLEGPDAEAAVDAAHRIRAALQQEPMAGGFIPRVSIGIARSGVDEDEDAEGLLRAADVALYAAKQAGKDCVFDGPESTVRPRALSPTR
jgi:diguanylate cyclase (GGDEF)-like protein